MSFCFNFSSSNENIKPCETEISHAFQSEEKSLAPCKYLSYSDTDFQIQQDTSPQSLKCGSFEVKYISQKCVQNELKNMELLKDGTSDLLPGKYEGGFKVWECSVDLAAYLSEHKCIQPGNEVLELGCGVGLPGIVAYLSGGFVTFQDFNAEVLKLVTGPSVRLNASNTGEDISKKCTFLCGDWQQINKTFYKSDKEKKMFDVILTSETIYEKCNQTNLLDLMKEALKSDGIIYLASKVHYFGVGGGLTDFEQLLKEDGTFNFVTIFQTSGGVERRILKICRKMING